MQEINEVRTLSLKGAKRLADAAIAEAEARGFRMHVTVTDAAGNVLVYQRMDGAPLPAREFSEKKAFTAVGYGKPTSVWKRRLAENPHLATGLSQHPRLAMIAGGLCVEVDGEIVGAIGIAGGLEEDDETVARAALERYLSEGV
ncbi:MAG: hypothetical protein Kow006_10500 [Gammaproteobacteria bacterium]